jgi:hypothetical protein
MQPKHEELAKAIKENLTLSSLRLRGKTPDFVNSFIKQIFTPPCPIQRLDLSLCRLTTEHIVHICENTYFTSLKGLNLKENNLTDGALEAISKILKDNTKIEEIDLSMNHQLTSGGM